VNVLAITTLLIALSVSQSEWILRATAAVALCSALTGLALSFVDLSATREKRRKRRRAIPECFRANYYKGLINIGLIKDKSELTEEKLARWALNPRVIARLEKHEATGVRDLLEEFASLVPRPKKWWEFWRRCNP